MNEQISDEWMRAMKVLCNAGVREHLGMLTDI